MHGWLIIDKPVGLGSTPVVGAVKRALREGGYPKVKVGHGGTLDPLASGVLPIALGEATKLSGHMLDADKAYDFTIRFGAQTDTLDAEGQVVATSDRRPTLADVEAVLPRFTGPIDQVPPAFSALKVDGRRAYELARAGEEVELATRRVTIHALSTRHPELVSGAVPPPAQAEEWMLKQVQHDETGLNEITLSARVSKGTYIRSLARDIALALGTVGSVTMLRRTRAGPFTLGPAISLDNLGQLAKERRLEEALLPLAAGLDDIPALTVTPREADLLRHGQQPTGSAARPGLHLALLDEIPVALVECSGGILRVVRGFNL
jgi:tRNA pseudouridine55 synthase